MQLYKVNLQLLFLRHSYHMFIDPWVPRGYSAGCVVRKLHVVCKKPNPNKQALQGYCNCMLLHYIIYLPQWWTLSHHWFHYQPHMYCAIITIHNLVERIIIRRNLSKNAIVTYDLSLRQTILYWTRSFNINLLAEAPRRAFYIF